MQFSQRMEKIPPYLFAELDRLKQEKIAQGVDVISLGIGDPDTPTAPFIVESMQKAVEKAEHHVYPPYEGIKEFRQAVADFYKRRYNVEDLNPADEIIALLGSKEGIPHISLAVLDPGDLLLVPDPGYPVYSTGAVFAGAESYIMPLLPERSFLPDFAKIPSAVAERAKMMFLNYPNNPTGAVAPRTFFERAVEFARRHDLVLAHDAAYSEVYLGSERPPSVLEVEGARDIAVEFHSLSKTFNMTGWRLGFAAGRPDVLAALAKVKANLDSGAFGALQEAGIEAYAGIDRPEIAATRKLYRQRAEVLCAGLRSIGFRVDAPKATFYVWAGVPPGYDGMQVANKLLDEAFVVCIPGIGFGEGAANYVRFALTVDTDRIATAIARLRKLHW